MNMFAIRSAARLGRLTGNNFCGPAFARRSLAVEVIRNEHIAAESLRLVYTDETGKSAWQIMTKAEALKFARDRDMDLILGFQHLPCLT